jgi:N-acetylmuramoyl-L-alanine amidase CwlA
MAFLERYLITPNYLTKPSKRRSGRLITAGVKFIVAHDTGNPGSTAAGNVRYYENSRDQVSASAHLFVDDKAIIECIPALTAPPEKAWHVLYNLNTDNLLYGHDANDAAIGVEYCYGDNINADEAYRKYIWVMAYICHRFGLDPAKSVTGHFFLDPKRKTDPVTGLAHSRRTYDQLLRDVVTEYQACTGDTTSQPAPPPSQAGSARVNTKLNIRKGAPRRTADVVQEVAAGAVLPFTGWVEDGEPVNGNSRWYQDANGNFFWSGGVTPL